jgi:hypothetical protein
MPPPEPSPPRTPEELARELEERLRDQEIRDRRWRTRRRLYATLVMVAGASLPALSLLAAGAITGGGAWPWARGAGALPLGLTVAGGALVAGLGFVRGWGVALGMIAFGALFIGVVGITRGVLGDLLPAMPGLVSLFVVSGAVVGYLITLEEGE